MVTAINGDASVGGAVAAMCNRAWLPHDRGLDWTELHQDEGIFS
jgi:hypothetical protein